MSKFIALPVGQGDAFYLERKKFRVLVDGGRSKSAISSLMNAICKSNHLNVLVCTHNDCDHANGVIGLLENWEGKIGEVWLPGTWTTRMKDLFVHPKQFMEELLCDLISLNVHDQFEPQSLEDLIRTEGLDSPRTGHEDKIEFSLEEIVEASDEREDDEWFWSGLTNPVARKLFLLIRPLTEKQISLLCNAIEAASRIRIIAKLAYRRGCKVRFFEFCGKPPGRRDGLLIPVNSQETLSIASAPIGILRYLALTTANKESLVFYSPEVGKEPAVLFAADSDLNFPLFGSQTKPPIVTSPHHGSDQNGSAYNVVNNWTRTSDIEPIWVRCDCKSKKRPGSRFLAQKTRLCTLCNNGDTGRQAVRLHSRQGAWQVTRGTTRCNCG